MVIMHEIQLHPMWPYNTARPVDARWHWACVLVDGGRKPTDKLDDAWIKRGWSYLTRLRACQSDGERNQLTCDFPAIDAAYRLYSTDDKLERAIVQARLLARQTVAEVSAATGLATEAIEAFEALFFQVFGRLGSPAFILTEAVGMDLLRISVRENDTDVLLRLYAYKLGPRNLERVLRYLRSGLRIPTKLEEATDAELEELAAMLRIRAFVLAHVLPFPQCTRATRTFQLADEVKAYSLLRVNVSPAAARSDEVTASLSQVNVSPAAIPPVVPQNKPRTKVRRTPLVA